MTETSRNTIAQVAYGTGRSGEAVTPGKVARCAGTEESAAGEVLDLMNCFTKSGQGYILSASVLEQCGGCRLKRGCKVKAEIERSDSKFSRIWTR